MLYGLVQRGMNGWLRKKEKFYLVREDFFARRNEKDLRGKEAVRSQESGFHP